MTVETQTQKITANGNASATSFSFSPIVIFASTDLEVTHVDADGVETVLTEGTGASKYAVVVSSYPGTGSITYPEDEVTPLPSGEKLIIKRVLTIEQTVDLENQGGYFPDTQEEALDKMVMIDLQQQEEIDRSLKTAIGETTLTTVDLPNTSDGNAGDVIALASGKTSLEYLTPNSSTYVTFPASATDNAVPRFNGTSGTSLQGSSVVIDDSDNVSGIVNLTFTGTFNPPTGAVATADIADEAVTLTKLQHITTDRLVGRDTAATGDPEELTVGGGVEFTGSGGIQRSALTGDVTASAGSNTTAIANNVVSEPNLKDAFIGDFTEVTVTASDSILLGDADDSGNTKRDTVQGIIDLVGGGITLGTEQTTTSGTSVTFGSIPSGTKRITIMFNGVSYNSTNDMDVTIGDSGGLETSEYVSSSHRLVDTSIGVVNSTAEFIINLGSASETVSGHITLTLENEASNTWVASHAVKNNTNSTSIGGGSKSLSGELTQVSISGGTFDAGAINIMYE